jgi:NAD-dependent dihydropyrimidine dehydrogenase PreA subunit
MDLGITNLGFEEFKLVIEANAMGEFIKLEIDLSKCTDMSDVDKRVQVCPVNIFKAEGGQPAVVEENEDECTLCMLCIEAFPQDAVTIHKLYET